MHCYSKVCFSCIAQEGLFLMHCSSKGCFSCIVLLRVVSHALL